MVVGPGCMRALRLRNLEDREVLRPEAPLKSSPPGTARRTSIRRWPNTAKAGCRPTLCRLLVQIRLPSHLCSKAQGGFDPWALQPRDPDLSALAVVRPPNPSAAGEAAVALARADASFLLLLDPLPESALAPLHRPPPTPTVRWSPLTSEATEH